jgi:hypothetical protein
LICKANCSTEIFAMGFARALARYVIIYEYD